MQNGFQMPRNLFKLKIRQLSLNAGNWILKRYWKRLTLNENIKIFPLNFQHLKLGLSQCTHFLEHEKIIFW